MVPSLSVAFDENTVNMRECIIVTASDDDIFEMVEDFTLQLTVADSPILAIDSSRNTATVAILDTDGKDTPMPCTMKFQNHFTDGHYVAVHHGHAH